MNEFERRFWKKVDIVCGQDVCWPWTGATLFGRGRFNVDGRSAVASRVAYELVHGTIPTGLIVCHSCDNPACCNPHHLWLGTNLDNSTDMCRKGRAHSKITADQVREIFADPRILREVASDFGISNMAVHRIRTGKAWRHITAPNLIGSPRAVTFPSAREQGVGSLRTVAPGGMSPPRSASRADL